VAVDKTDGSLWICSAISNTVLHLDRNLKITGSFEAPFEQFDRHEVGGIAYNPVHDTLYLTQPILNEIWEVEKDGTSTGKIIPLALPSPVNIIPRPYARGIAFDSGGDGGKGSLWLVEGVMTAIYEIALDGEILSSFCHPDDPDGCPGKGLAAQSGDIAIFLKDGSPAGLELLGGRERRDQIVRVNFEGSPQGVSFSLAEVGGKPGGFARGQARDPRTGDLKDVYFVSVESSAELHVVEALEPDLRPISSLECQGTASQVDLHWESFDDYERVDVFRDGELLASLPGSSRSFTDIAAPDGVLEYRVVASRGECDSAERCSAVVGAGRVLRSAPLEGGFAVGMAEDGDGYLWVTNIDNQLQVFDKDLNPITSLLSPFQGEKDDTSAIAYNPSGPSLFVYNAYTNEVAEINNTGELLSSPFPSGVPSDPEDEAAVASMLYDPAGAGGAGSFWYLDYTTGTIQERDRAGQLLRSCVHPDHAAEVPPDKSVIDAWAWGMSTVPGLGFSFLELTGGKARDGLTTRIFRMDLSSCLPTGEEIPTDGIAELGIPYVLGLLLTTHGGRTVAYVVLPALSDGGSRLLEVEVRPPRVPHLPDLSCRQLTEARNVEVTFTNPGGLDAVEILRDGALVAALPGDAASFNDLAVPPGIHGYQARGKKGGERGDDRTCSLRVGQGSVAAREFAFPGTLVHEVAFDPVGGGYVTASTSNRVAENLQLFDSSLRFSGNVLSPFPPPQQIAAMAVRSVGGATEVYCLGWLPGAAPGTQLHFPMSVIDLSGRVLRRLTIEPPRPRGAFLIYPTGMAWDQRTDTLWYLERNSATVVNIALDGRTLLSFPHPAPIYQDFVYNYGLAIDSERNALYLSGAGRFDFQVTKLVELTRHGELTGVEIPVGEPLYDRIMGFALSPDGAHIVGFSIRGSVQDLVLYRAFDSLPAVGGLACSVADREASLSWGGGGFDTIEIYRGRELAASVPGSDRAWRDPEPGTGRRFYRVVGKKGELSSAGAICEVAFPRPFLRGDVEENGLLNISDAVSILSYLFNGGRAPACLEAADVDDKGDLNISDAISVLGFLFLSKPAPPPPFPDPGFDPTPDGLGCGG
jgi:DNA-binding beta-propeller fold protein YncE